MMQFYLSSSSNFPSTQEVQCRTMYSISLMSNAEPCTQEDDILDKIQRVWKASIPSKAKIFGWRVMLNKLPIKIEL